MKIGFSKTIITPHSPIGIQLGGYAPRKLCTGVHDNLYARAVYIEGKTEAIETHCLLMVCDLLSIDGTLYDLVVKKLSKSLPLKIENIMISATHTHHGPDYRGLFKPGGKLALLKGFLFPEPEIKGLIKLGKKLIKVALKAYERRKRAKIGAVQTTIPQRNRIIINRRDPYKYDKAKYPLTVIKAISNESKTQGELLGVILNYACHGTVLPRENTLITADYVGYLIRSMEEKLNREKAEIVYFNGPCGEINPLSEDLKEKMSEKGKEGLTDEDIYQQLGTWTDAKSIGEIIASEALHVLDNINCVATDEVRVLQKKMYIPIRDYKYGNDFQSALNRLIFKIKLNLFSWLLRLGILNTNIFFNLDKLQIKSHIQSIIQVIKIGEIVIGTAPGEYFLELGNEVREYAQNLYPTSIPFIIELANDSIGYLYTVDAYREGGYESSFSITPLGGGYITFKLKRLINSINQI
jgi:hypothetical protein